jgi:uncharacterized RDD family membrane protein YckC
VFHVRDALSNGQSLGKRLAGIAVVDADSLAPCSPIQAVRRNQLMTEALSWLLILVERLGGRRAGFRGDTLVVRMKVLREVRRR